MTLANRMSINVQGLCMHYVSSLFKDWKSLKTHFYLIWSFNFLFSFVCFSFLVSFQ